MGLGTIYGYKLWDSLLGVVSVTWEFSTDRNFNNIVLSNTTDGNKLIEILAITHDDIYCRVKINGSNGSTDWFLVKEDKSNYNYITASDDKYSINIGHNKPILGELILNKDGDVIHDFNFVDKDEVIYLTQYNKILDLDFLNHLDFNTKWFYENTGMTNNGIYRDQLVSSGDDFLTISIIVKDDTKLTSNLVYKEEVMLEDSYVEIRLNPYKLADSTKYISFTDMNNTVFKISNKNGNLYLTVNDTEFSVLPSIEDKFYLIGIDTSGRLYVNHKVEVYSGIDINKFDSIHIGNTFDNATIETGKFVIDWIRVFKNTLPNDIIAE